MLRLPHIVRYEGKNNLDSRLIISLDITEAKYLKFLDVV